MNELATAYEPSELLKKLADDLGPGAVAESLGIDEAVLGLLLEGQAEMDDDVVRIRGCCCNSSDSVASVRYPLAC